MSFCMVCGRGQTTASRFCGGCGAEFGDPARHEKVIVSPWPTGFDTAPPLPDNGAAPVLPDNGAAPVLPDNGAARLAGGWDAAGDVVSVASSGGWDPSAPHLVRPRQEPVPPAEPDAFSALLATVDSYRGELPSASIGRSAGRAPHLRGRAIIVAAVAVVVFGAAGGAYALAAGHGPARAGTQPTGRASASATPSAAGQGTPASPAAVSPRAGPATGAATVAGVVAVAVAAGAAGNPAAPRVTALLDRYFTAINRHDYAAYASLLDRQRRRRDPAASFEGGYASTTDSDETLTRISAVGSGDVAASVTFTSHQKPAVSRDDSSCTLWAITLYLVPHGTGYLIGTPPAGYWASYQAC
jgi:hypothetical protein